MSDGYRHRYPTKCPGCGTDLTREEIISVEFTAADHEFARRSRVDEEGWLIDVDRLVENGYHSGSECVRCNEDLTEHEIHEGQTFYKTQGEEDNSDMENPWYVRRVKGECIAVLDSEHLADMLLESLNGDRPLLTQQEVCTIAAALSHFVACFPDTATARDGFAAFSHVTPLLQASEIDALRLRLTGDPDDDGVDEPEEKEDP